LFEASPDKCGEHGFVVDPGRCEHRHTVGMFKRSGDKAMGKPLSSRLWQANS
jgi:hypothetical protein